MTYQDKLEERQEKLENLKNKQEQIEDDRTAQRVQMLLRKMARTIDRTNFDVYESEVKNLIEADSTVHR